MTSANKISVSLESVTSRHPHASVIHYLFFNPHKKVVYMYLTKNHSIPDALSTVLKWVSFGHFSDFQILAETEGFSIMMG